MMECLLAEIRTNQVKAGASLKEMKEVAASLEAMIQSNQGRVEANQGEIMVKLDAYHERKWPGRTPS
jgi:hypothetical protein